MLRPSHLSAFEKKDEELLTWGVFDVIIFVYQNDNNSIKHKTGLWWKDFMMQTLLFGSLLWEILLKKMICLSGKIKTSRVNMIALNAVLNRMRTVCLPKSESRVLDFEVSASDNNFV